MAEPVVFIKLVGDSLKQCCRMDFILGFYIGNVSVSICEYEFYHGNEGVYTIL